MDTLKYCDFSIICRICLTKGGMIHSDAVISNIFHKITDLDFEADDLPQQICQKCFDKINDICEFSFQCKRSHSTLIECLNLQKSMELKENIAEGTHQNISNEHKERICKYDVEKGTTTNFEIKTEELKNVDVISEDEDELDEDTTIPIPYECDKCSQTFETELTLLRHNCTSSVNRLYKCDKRVHGGERLYKCDECSKSFLKLHLLKRHEKVHSGERPYKCNQCSKRFCKSIILRRHKQVHSSLRPYKCDQCSYNFNQIQDLKRHKLIHSGERPYKCDQCPKDYIRKYHLKMHMKSHTTQQVV